MTTRGLTCFYSPQLEHAGASFRFCIVKQSSGSVHRCTRCAVRALITSASCNVTVFVHLAREGAPAARGMISAIACPVGGRCGVRCSSCLMKLKLQNQPARAVRAGFLFRAIAAHKRTILAALSLLRRRHTKTRGLAAWSHTKHTYTRHAPATAGLHNSQWFTGGAAARERGAPPPCCLLPAAPCWLLSALSQAIHRRPTVCIGTKDRAFRDGRIARAWRWGSPLHAAVVVVRVGSPSHQVFSVKSAPVNWRYNAS